MFSLAQIPPADAFLSFGALSLYRAVVATPLEALTKLTILSPDPTITIYKVISSTPVRQLRKGFQPNCLRFLTRTPVQLGSLKGVSLVVPSGFNPTARGFIIGFISSLIEALWANGWTVIATRFVQGQQWNVLKKEGPSLLGKGFVTAWAHRSFSGAIFRGTYENLRQINPEYPAVAGMAAGITQVCLTAPFYIVTILRQGQNPPTETLFLLFKKIIEKQGLVSGLFLRGLAPRIALSLCTTGPLMKLIEHYGVVSR